MSNKETGGPAYARPRGNGWDESSNSQTGMTLRDYFAGQAMTGIDTTQLDQAQKWAKGAWNEYNIIGQYYYSCYNYITYGDCVLCY